MLHTLLFHFGFKGYGCPGGYFSESDAILIMTWFAGTNLVLLFADDSFEISKQRVERNDEDREDSRYRCLYMFV